MYKVGLTPSLTLPVGEGKILYYRDVTQFDSADEND